MNETVRTWFTDLNTGDKEQQFKAYNQIMVATNEEVNWAYEVWDGLVLKLTDKDAHERSRAAQFLSHLAKSDPEKRIMVDFPKIWAVTYDEKFVTARHSLQSIWHIALAGVEQKEMVLRYLAERFANCVEEKNYTLIRFDVIESLKKMYDRLNEESIKNLAIQLIDTEEDLKYKKKYEKVWK